MQKEKEIWVLSICQKICPLNPQNAQFHFRGYYAGKWVKKICIESSSERGWIIGRTYLIKMIYLNHNLKGELFGRVLTSRLLRTEEIWDEF